MLSGKMKYLVRVAAIRISELTEERLQTIAQAVVAADIIFHVDYDDWITPIAGTIPNRAGFRYVALKGHCNDAKNLCSRFRTGAV